jgi:hypothetical protein
MAANEELNDDPLRSNSATRFAENTPSFYAAVRGFLNSLDQLHAAH